MSDEIPPALTPDQWRDFGNPNPPYNTLRHEIALACDGIGYDLHQSPAALIALANAALPDDSPHKITRADLRALHMCVAPSPNDLDAMPVRLRRMHAEACARALAKIAALLPP